MFQIAFWVAIVSSVVHVATGNPTSATVLAVLAILSLGFDSRLPRKPS